MTIQKPRSWPKQSQLKTAVLDYRAALFEYGDGLISWHELARRLYAVRRVLQMRRSKERA
jgi:hypothetical protein